MCNHLSWERVPRGNEASNGEWSGGVGRRLQRKTSLRRAVQQKGRKTNLWEKSVPDLMWLHPSRKGQWQEMVSGRSAAASTGRPRGRRLDFILSVMEGHWEL